MRLGYPQPPAQTSTRRCAPSQRRLVPEASPAPACESSVSRGKRPGPAPPEQDSAREQLLALRPQEPSPATCDGSTAEGVGCARDPDITNCSSHTVLRPVTD